MQTHTIQFLFPGNIYQFPDIPSVLPTHSDDDIRGRNVPVLQPCVPPLPWLRTLLDAGPFMKALLVTAGLGILSLLWGALVSAGGIGNADRRGNAEGHGGNYHYITMLSSCANSMY